MCLSYLKCKIYQNVSCFKGRSHDFSQILFSYIVYNTSNAFLMIKHIFSYYHCLKAFWKKEICIVSSSYCVQIMHAFLDGFHNYMYQLLHVLTYGEIHFQRDDIGNL